MVDLLGGVEHFFIVRGLSRNIVGAVDQDDVIVFAVVVVFNDFIIEGTHSFIVRQLFLLKLHKQGMGAVRAFVADGILQVVEIFSDASGKGLFKDLIIFEDLLLGKSKKGLLQSRPDIFFCIHVAAADAGDGVVVFFELFLYF